MLYLLSGTDRFSLFERKRRLEDQFFHTSPAGEKFAFDVEEAWGTTEQASLSAALASGGLFATPHLIVIRGVENLNEQTAEWLRQMLSTRHTDALVIVIYWLAPRKKLPSWWQALARQGIAENFTGPNTSFYQELIDATLIDFGVTLEQRAKNFLLEVLAHDVGRLVQEVKRLALASASSVITLDKVKTSVVFPREHNVFAALDSLTRGDRARAITLFRQEETDVDAPFALLGLCAWQVRRLISVKELAEQEQMNAAVIAKELKTSPYSIQKVLPLLPRLSSVRLRQALIFLADIDQAIKTGRMRPGVALDLFVWKF